MLPTTIVAVLLVAAIGLAFKYSLKALNDQSTFYESKQITWREYVIALAVLAIVVAPSVMAIGKAMSQDQKLKYYEMYNGVEVAATVSVTECYGGHSGNSYSAGTSNCSHTYVSGSYSWSESRTVCTGSGKDQTCTIVTDWYSADIHTPYATKELTYTVNNSFGQTYTYPSAYLEKNPRPYGNEPIPGNLPHGAPADWTEAKQRIDARDPRPVTDVFEYDNYILASADETLAPFSQDVEKYKKARLLPDHTAGILENPIFGDSRKQAKKLSFVGVKVPNEQEWQESLMRLNAALGSKKQGDLHVVVIDSKRIKDPQGYLKALRAYWLGDHFGKFALSKNGIILVIGTSDGKVDWAQMDTGMPYGNNPMIGTTQRTLPGKDLDPDVIFGKPRTIITPATKEGEKDKVEIGFSSPKGVLEDVLFEPATAFKRPCMTCEDDEDAGQVGYSDLIEQIEPSTSQKVWMVVAVCGFSLLAWGFVAGTSVLERRRDRKPPTPRRPSYYGY